MSKITITDIDVKTEVSSADMKLIKGGAAGSKSLIGDDIGLPLTKTKIGLEPKKMESVDDDE